MMTTNDLYQRAIKDVAPGGRYGVAKHPLSDGSTLICCVDKVAGRSIVRGHMLTSYLLLEPGEDYSRNISKAKAAAILKVEAGE